MSHSPASVPAPNGHGVVPPMPPFELANRVGALNADAWEEHYDRLGAAMRRAVDELLPEDWTWEGKTVLDFGSGAGRALRHFYDLTPQNEVWGCDLHAESIAWLNEHLAPMRGLVCRHRPGLKLADAGVDLVWATSVFTHLTDHWAGWLLELHRVLRPGGVLIASFLGEAMSDALAHEPWDEDRIGMNVTAYDESFDVGGPNTLMSPWWIRARWSRAFDIVEIRPSGFMRAPGQGHGVVVARKRAVDVTIADLERPDEDEPREWQALIHQRTQLYREMKHWRDEARRLQADPRLQLPSVEPLQELPDDVVEVLETVPALIEENETLAAQLVELAREAAELEAALARA